MNGTDLLTEYRVSRSERAFAQLVQRYTNLVYSAARRRLANDAAAQEATQSVFIRLATAAPDLRDEAALVSWLHRTIIRFRDVRGPELVKAVNALLEE
jgi:RNA polymerase sigma factor (sigma-70 family)